MRRETDAVIGAAGKNGIVADDELGVVPQT